MNNDVADKIQTARIIECCRKHYEIYISAFVTIFFVVFLAFDKGDNLILFLWAATTGTILILRIIFVDWFVKLKYASINNTHIYIFTFIMLIWGIAWGSATLLFFPLLSTLEQAAWFAMFMVMIAASATSHSVYLSAFFAFSSFYFLAMLYMVAVQFPSPFHINAIIFVLVMITQIGAARKGQNVILESLRLRFENIELVEDLKQQRDAAEKANQAKSKFLAAASHDLRQPLHALTLFSGALEDSLDDKEKSLILTQHINESLEALQDLFNALLDISRLDAGTLECEKKAFLLSTLVNKLENDFTPLAIEKHIQINWNVPNVVLYTDPTLLELILRNLVSNAIRYTNEGEIDLAVTQFDDSIEIAIVDSGIGISIADQETIFEEFVQLHNSHRDRKKGLGLGLSIVKRVANLMGTDVSVTSPVRNHKGARFAFTIPKGKLKNIEQANTQPTIENTQTQKLILVIDDEKSILTAMQALLSGWGYSVLTATELDIALQNLSKSGCVPDCVIVDYRLKNDMTGIQVIESLRQKFGQNLPAVIVSGDIGKEKIQNITNHGLPLLHKPTPPASLRSFLYRKMNEEITKH